MASTVFFSWQGDRPRNNCKNFVHRAIEDAIERLRLNLDVEESLREDLMIDSDTRNVPGSPPIFETILKKIDKTRVFVADLTFIGKRDDGTLMSNPNVLVEYGYALKAPGDHCIIAVINSAYGEASEKDIPFNLRGRRWPISYELSDKNTPEDRKTIRKALTAEIETALKMVVGSTEFQAESDTVRAPTSLDMARLVRNKLDLQRDIDDLMSAPNESRIQQSVQNFLQTVNDKLTGIELSFGHGLEFRFTTSGGFWMAVRVGQVRSFHLAWHVSATQRKDETRLVVGEYVGRISLPGEQFPRYFSRSERPDLMGEEFYKPSLSEKRELGWSLQPNDSPFLSTETLAEQFALKVMRWLQ